MVFGHSFNSPKLSLMRIFEKLDIQKKIIELINLLWISQLLTNMDINSKLKGFLFQVYQISLRQINAFITKI
ncbi:MAG: hypothetical protein CMM99_06140 [Rickettsiales bacterium]|nr:hypothetical protein [Rickettsiales bacterium]